MASLGVSLPWGAWLFGANVNYTGERPDTAFNPMLAAYAVTNVTVRYALSPEVALTARIDNLFDRSYQTAWGYNQPGIGAYAGIVWTQK
jgi:vitamin B12 transporter